MGCRWITYLPTYKSTYKKQFFFDNLYCEVELMGKRRGKFI